MKDEVIASLWKIKDDIAREHDYDVERLGAMVRERERTYADRVVDWSPARKRESRAVSEEHEAS